MLRKLTTTVSSLRERSTALLRGMTPTVFTKVLRQRRPKLPGKVRSQLSKSSRALSSTHSRCHSQTCKISQTWHSSQFLVVLVPICPGPCRRSSTIIETYRSIKQQCPQIHTYTHARARRYFSLCVHLYSSLSLSLSLARWLAHSLPPSKHASDALA